MKKIFLLVLFFGSTVHFTVAQNDKHENLKALKTAFITQELDLSPKEAEKFWPIYNGYDEKIHEIKVIKYREGKNKINQRGGFDALTEKEADEFLTALIKNEEDELKAKKELFKQLKNVLSSKKIVQLEKAEHDFNRKLLREYHNKSGQGKKMP
jgi:hypothetical protein